MALVNLPPINDGEEASSKLFNDRFSALVDALNGGLDTENLSSGAVTTSNLGEKAVTSAKIADEGVTNLNIARGAVLLASATINVGEQSYTNSAWVFTSVTATFTTTKPNQVVTALARIQTYAGGYSQFIYKLDGNFAGDSAKYRTGINDQTTGAYLHMDFFTVPLAGSHTVQLWAYSGGGLRIIHGEGLGKIVVISS